MLSSALHTFLAITLKKNVIYEYLLFIFRKQQRVSGRKQHNVEALSMSKNNRHNIYIYLGVYSVCCIQQTPSTLLKMTNNSIGISNPPPSNIEKIGEFVHKNSVGRGVIFHESFPNCFDSPFAADFFFSRRRRNLFSTPSTYSHCNILYRYAAIMYRKFLYTLPRAFPVSPFNPEYRLQRIVSFCLHRIVVFSHIECVKNL